MEGSHWLVCSMVLYELVVVVIAAAAAAAASTLAHFPESGKLDSQQL